jgi:two-component system response regulator GlrR
MLWNGFALKLDFMALVLVVDDDESQRFLVASALLNAGHRVVEAENGSEAYKVFISSRPQLVITDIQMPVRDGLALISDIRQCNSAIPIVAMSAGSLYLLQKARALGANKCVSKGTNLDDLLNQFEKLLMHE